MSDQPDLCDIGFIGLGVMGKNLALNLADNGYKIAVFDLEHQKIEDAMAQDKAESGTGGRIIGCSSYTELLSILKVPHLIILSIPAGDIVDDVCHKLVDAGIKADDIVVIPVIAFGLTRFGEKRNTLASFTFSQPQCQAAKWAQDLGRH